MVSVVERARNESDAQKFSRNSQLRADPLF
jgi:hypothetical protein